MLKMRPASQNDATALVLVHRAPADGLARELTLQQVLEFGRRRQFVQAAPVIAPASALQPGPEGAPYRGQVCILLWIAHRWQVEQLVSVRAFWIWYSATSLRPISS